MNETMITLNGIVVTDLKKGEVKGASVVSFRFLSTVRRFERTRGGWFDAETNFVTITCWRGLADNVGKCVEKGDPLVVFGRLKVRPWDSADRSGSTVEVDAYAVGHDLNRGTSKFTRAKKDEVEAKEDTIEETAKKVRESAEEEGWQAEKAILAARRAATTIDPADILAGATASGPKSAPNGASEDAAAAGTVAAAAATDSGNGTAGGPASGSGTDAVAAGSPAQPGAPVDPATSPDDSDGPTLGEEPPDTGADEQRRGGKRAVFGLAKSKDKEPAGV